MQLTTLTFNFSLHPGNIRAFRASIVEVVGLGHHLFHGHDNSVAGEIKYSNAYPLIRFGVRKGRACITGMGEGADALLRYLVPILPDTLLIAGKPCATTDWRIENRQWTPELASGYCTFGIHQWMALNKNNYTAWKKYADNAGAQRLILDRCLTGHLRALAENSNPALDRSMIVARVLQQDRVKKIQWKNNDFVLFNVIAEANFMPPFGLGLGRCHSFGFGEVCSERSYQALQQKRVRQRELVV